MTQEKEHENATSSFAGLRERAKTVAEDARNETRKCYEHFRLSKRGRKWSKENAINTRPKGEGARGLPYNTDDSTPPLNNTPLYKSTPGGIFFGFFFDRHLSPGVR